MSEKNHKCSSCGEQKHWHEMLRDKNSESGVTTVCKTCNGANVRKWKSLHKEQVSASRLKKTYRQRRGWVMKCRYGITIDQYDDMAKSQGSKCAICGRSTDLMSYFLNVDHCHETNTVRGLLCSPCNVYIGYIKDNPQIAGQMASYLSRTAKAK